MKKIGIVGAGAWGTALAQTIAKIGHDVILWAREKDLVHAINQTHNNPLYLEGITLHPTIRATNNMKDAIHTDLVLIVCPAQHMRAIITQGRQWWKQTPVIICNKGIEQTTNSLMTEIIAELLPDIPVAVLSGPTFAIEVASNLPTAVTLAAESNQLRQELAQTLGSSSFRIYTTNDIIGTEISGAAKNVFAIACGIVQGKKLGDNARAALITRGMAELARLTMAMGGQAETLLGLSGIGDMILTCNAMQSRNFSLGFELAKDKSLSCILEERNTVAEGVMSSIAIKNLAQTLRVETPIINIVHDVLHQGLPIDEAITTLLARPLHHQKELRL